MELESVQSGFFVDCHVPSNKGVQKHAVKNSKERFFVPLLVMSLPGKAPTVKPYLVAFVNTKHRLLILPNNVGARKGKFIGSNLSVSFPHPQIQNGAAQVHNTGVSPLADDNIVQFAAEEICLTMVSRPCHVHCVFVPALPILSQRSC